ncbi:phosphatidylglycerophosphatase A [Campylobacter sp. US33a]|uniref:phosphatidylglycerophosphatase A family protein n=1 Tax=Campylobacter sp. US33a TaxID=2498120 RepID=UPI001067E57E|nr:phosphatidylglycerophosphatase A [Campylobacter sp. US33a]TEY03058.1 phosphatidylglycerophosphatase A [Campylobacter sp. US33a]
MIKFYVTFFYSGCVKKAPGTFGTLAALIPAFFILKYLGITTLFLLSFLIFFVSIKIIDEYEKQSGIHDDKHVVIDEVAGVFLALAICGNTLFTFILSFILFRIFDITKPSIIGKIDKKTKGGLGVMLDDMLAGAFAGLLCAIIYGVMMKFDFVDWDVSLQNLF